jgi:ferric enterobactin transport system substrate-binding protein
MSAVLSPEPVDDATRRELLVGGAALAVLGLAACGSDEEPDAGEATRSVQTDKGAVRVPADPRRIVVLSGSLTGYLLALGAPVVASDTRVLGVPVDDSGFPGIWSEEAQRQGTEALPAGDLNVEAVAATNPDLIVGGGQGFTAMQAAQAYDKLTRIAPTVLVSDKLATWQEQLAYIAEVLGAEDRAAELMRAYEERVAAVREAIALPPQPTAVLLLTAGDKQFVVPQHAMLPALLDELGFRIDDVLRKAGNPKLYGTGDSFEVSLERLADVADAPTLIAISVSGRSVAELAEDPIYARLPAFRARRVHELPALSYRPDYYAVLETLELVRDEFAR